MGRERECRQGWERERRSESWGGEKEERVGRAAVDPGKKKRKIAMICKLSEIDRDRIGCEGGSKLGLVCRLID